MKDYRERHFKGVPLKELKFVKKELLECIGSIEYELDCRKKQKK